MQKPMITVKPKDFYASNKAIADLEAKLRIAVSALEHYAFLYRHDHDRHLGSFAREALDKLKGGAE